MVATLTNPDLPTLSPEDEHLLLRYMHHNERLTPLAAELLSSLPLPEGGGRGVGSSKSAATPELSSPPASPLHPLTSSPVPPHSPLPTPHSPPPTPLSLLIWTASPHIAPYISLYRKHIAHLDHRKAIDALKEIIDSSDDPIEKRRAASSMLRLLNQSRAAQGAAPRDASSKSPRIAPDPHNAIDEDDALIDQADDEDPSENSALGTEHAALSASQNSALGTRHSALSPPPSLQSALAAKNAADFPSPNRLIPYHFKSTTPVLSIPEAFADKPGQIDSVPHAPLPDPGRTANDVALLIMSAIKSPDSPSDGAGPRILFNLQGYIRDRSLAAFTEYKNNYLRNCVGDAWHHTDCKLEHHSGYGNKTKFQAALTLSNGSLHYLFLSLEKIAGGTLKDCWVIDHLYFDHRPTLPPKAASPPPLREPPREPDPPEELPRHKQPRGHIDINSE